MPSYLEIFNGPARNYRRDGSGRPITSRKRYITIHNTSNDASAEGEASYAKVRTDGTSSHYYVDNNSIVQSLNTDWCAGHVGSLEGNTYGISYEITGVNGWNRETWLSNVAWSLLARSIARDCLHFGIPVKRLTVAEMKTRTMAGFITHNDARLAWGQTTHTDPGPGFPMDHLLALVGQYMDGDEDVDAEDVKAVWQYYQAPPGPMGPAYNVLDHVLFGEKRADAAANGVAEANAKLDKLTVPQPAPVDPATLRAALMDVVLHPDVLAAVAKAVNDDAHKRLAG